MTGEQLRLILRYNCIPNSEITRLAGISLTKLSGIFLRDEGEAHIPDIVMFALCKILGNKYSDDDFVNDKIEKMGKNFREQIFLDNRRHYDHSFVALNGGFYVSD